MEGPDANWKSAVILFLQLATWGQRRITTCSSAPVLCVAPWETQLNHLIPGIMLQFESSSQLCPRLKQPQLQQLFPTARKEKGSAGVFSRSPDRWSFCLSETANERGVGLAEAGDAVKPLRISYCGLLTPVLLLLRRAR